MAEPFIGEIDFFPYNFVPENYCLCDGRLLPVVQYQALYSLIGNTYGGTLNQQFGVPNLIGTVAVGVGSAAGGTINWTLASRNGTESVTLTLPQTPAHNHTLPLLATNPNKPIPAAGAAAGGVTPQQFFGLAGAGNTTMHPSTLTLSPGGGQAHENRQPYLAIMPCIALGGVYPSFPS